MTTTKELLELYGDFIKEPEEEAAPKTEAPPPEPLELETAPAPRIPVDIPIEIVGRRPAPPAATPEPEPIALSPVEEAPAPKVEAPAEPKPTPLDPEYWKQEAAKVTPTTEEDVATWWKDVATGPRPDPDTELEHVPPPGGAPEVDYGVDEVLLQKKPPAGFDEEVPRSVRLHLLQTGAVKAPEIEGKPAGYEAEALLDDDQFWWDVWRKQRLQAPGVRERMGAGVKKAQDQLREQEGRDRAIDFARRSTPKRYVAGTSLPVVDYFEMRDRVETHITRSLLDAEKTRPQYLSQKKKGEIAARARQLATAEMGRYMESGQDRILIDRYGRDATEWLMRRNALIRPILAITSGVEAPGEGEPRTGIGRLRSASALNMFGRMDASTIFAAMLLTGEGPSARKTIETIRSGVDIFDAANQVGELFLGLEEEMEEGLQREARIARDQGVPEEEIQQKIEDARFRYNYARKWWGTGGSVGAILFAPDPMSLTATGAAIGPKLLSPRLKMGRLSKGVKAHRAVVKEIRTTPAEDVRLRAIKQKLIDIDPVYGRAFDVALGERLAVTGDIPGAARMALDRAAALRREANEHLEQIAEVADEFAQAELKALAESKQAEAATQEYAATIFQQTFEELRMERLLEEEGMAAARIEEILDSGKLPVDADKAAARVTKQLKKDVKDARAEVAAAEATHKPYWELEQKAANSYETFVRVALKGTPFDGYVPLHIFARKADPAPVLALRTADGRKVPSRDPSGRFGPAATVIVDDVKPWRTNRVKIVMRRMDTGEEITIIQKVDPDLVKGLRRTRNAVHKATKEGFPHAGVYDAATKSLGKAELALKVAEEGGLLTRGMESLANIKGTRRITGKKYDAAKRAAKIGDKEVVRLRKIIADAGLKSVRKNMKADMLSKTMDHAADALEDIANGMEAFLKAARKEFGGIKALGRVSHDVAALGAVVSEEKIAKLADRAIANSRIRFNRKAGTATVNVDRVRSATLMRLNEQMGKPALRGASEAEWAASEKLLDEFMETLKGRPLRDALKATPEPEGMLLGPTLTYDAKQTEALQKSMEDLFRFSEARIIGDNARRWGRAIHLGFRDLELAGKSASRIRRIMSLTRRSMRVMENAASRVGTTGADLEAVIKSVDNVLDQFKLEFQATTTAKPDVIDTIAWVDSSTEVAPKHGMALWDMMTGQGTKWEKAKRQILTDHRADPRFLRKWQKLQDELYQTPVDNTVKRAALKKEMDRFQSEYLKKLDMDTAPVPLRALATMWLPSGAQIPPASASLLIQRAAKLVEESPDYATFSQKMLEHTVAITKHADVAVVAHGKGVSAIGLAGTLGYAGRRLSEAMTGPLSITQAADMNRLLRGEYNEIENLNDALEGFNRLGLPFTETQHKRLAGRTKVQVDRTRELVAMADEGEGVFVFIPRNILEELESNHDKIVKELEAINRSPVGAASRITDGLKTYYGLWRMSLVSGLYTPNPRYWTNNIFGDASQMFTEVGALRSGAQSFTNVLANIHPKLYDAQQQMIKSVQDRFGDVPVLPSVLESFFNPYLGRIFKGQEGFFVSTKGRVYQYDTVRKWAAEDDILDTFIHEELHDLYNRKIKTDWDKFLGKDAAQVWAGHAAGVQQRQRMGLYCQLLRSGESRAAAKERTLRALYDWKHGIAELEMQTAARVVVFWRFWRLAMRQLKEAAIEPLVKSTPEMLARAATGQTQFARIRQQALLATRLPDHIAGADDRIRDEHVKNIEILDHLARKEYAEWWNTRLITGAHSIDPDRAYYHRMQHGVDYTHQMSVWPTMTMLDLFMMGRIVPAGIAGLSLLGTTPDDPGMFDRRSRIAEDWETQLIEPILGSLGRPIEDTLRSAFSMWGFDLDIESRGTKRSVNAHDEAVIRSFGLDGWIFPGETQDGKAEVFKLGYLAFKMLPWFGTQLPEYVRAFGTENPELLGGEVTHISPITGKPVTETVVERDIKQGLWIAMKKLTRFGDVRYFDAPKKVERDIKEIRREIGKDFPEEKPAERPMRARIPE